MLCILKYTTIGSHAPSKAVDRWNEFAVSKVWHNLDVQGGYFGIYWFCSSVLQRFTLHCNIAKWNVKSWISTTEWNWEGCVNLIQLKKEVDDWVRTPEVSARLPSWSLLNVHECVQTKRRNYQWRAILKLRNVRVNKATRP